MSIFRPAMASPAARVGAPVLPNQAPQLGTYSALTRPHFAAWGRLAAWAGAALCPAAAKPIGIESMRAVAIARIDLPRFRRADLRGIPVSYTVVRTAASIPLEERL